MFLNYYCTATKEYCRLNKDNHKKIGLKLDKRLMDDFQAACICDECKTNQPERSKREDCKLDMNERICNCYMNYNCSCPTIKEALEYIQMRCSEHCGNTMRDK